MNEVFLKNYADLIVKTGVNIQKNQILVINSPIECADFTRIIAETAYKTGARDVVINWNDELYSKIRFIHAPEEVFDEFPAWEREYFLSYVRKGAAFITIKASDPELFKDVNPERLSKVQKIRNNELSEYRERLMGNKNTWCVVSIPTVAWAKKVFPDISEEEAMEKLWETIFKTVRADQQDPVASWTQHKRNLKESMDFLNNNKFKHLHFKNSLGTDLRIELPKDHVWLGGSARTHEEVEFIANMPTEEVFTLPKKTGVNGRVVSSMPLNYNGQLIEEFSLTFEEGKIVTFDAERGYETLKKLIETDEGASYLGEVALVPYDSPISKLNILFFNTLFDENASCHLAIGKAYPVCIEDGANKSKEELMNLGVNDSLVHVDFMIGTRDLDITGITADGKEMVVFKEGNFTF